MQQGDDLAVRARFDRVAGDWDSNPARVAMAKAVANAIRQAIPLRRDMEAMDLGAGTGLLTLALLPYVGAMTAVDASSGMLNVLAGKLADLKLSNVRTLHVDITTHSLPAAAFDLVVSSMALHHIRDVPAALARLRPCLRDGGWLALADLDTEDGTFHTDTTGVFHRGFDRPLFRQWLLSSKFTDIKVRDAHRLPRSGPNGKVREYGIFLATARAKG